MRTDKYLWVYKSIFLCIGYSFILWHFLMWWFISPVVTNNLLQMLHLWSFRSSWFLLMWILYYFVVPTQKSRLKTLPNVTKKPIQQSEKYSSPILDLKIPNKISNFPLTTYFTTTYLRSFCRRQQWAHNETYFAWVPCTMCNPNFYGYLLVAVLIWAHLINKVMEMGVCFKYFEPFFNPFFKKKCYFTNI